MKKPLRILGMLAVTALFLSACNNAMKKDEDMTATDNQEMIDDEKAEMEFTKAKAELKEQYKIAVANIDKEVKVIDAKMESANTKTKASLEKTKSDLLEEKNVLETKMDEVGDYTQEKWNEAKASALKAIDKSGDKLDSISNSVQDMLKS